MSSEMIQTLIVSVLALGAAGTLVWRLARPYFTKSAASAPCARCESGDKCAPAPAKEQIIQIQRPAR